MFIQPVAFTWGCNRQKLDLFVPITRQITRGRVFEAEGHSLMCLRNRKISEWGAEE